MPPFVKSYFQLVQVMLKQLLGCFIVDKAKLGLNSQYYIIGRGFGIGLPFEYLIG